jgi:hypothetical protein
MRFHKLPLQSGNARGALIIKLEISVAPGSAGIQGRWFHAWQLRFVESHQLIANLSPLCGQHGVLLSPGHSRQRSAEVEHFFTPIPADAVTVFQVN